MPDLQLFGASGLYNDNITVEQSTENLWFAWGKFKCKIIQLEILSKIVFLCI